MDHKAFLTSLCAEDRQHLNTKSDAAGLVHLLFHLGTISGISILIWLRVPFWQALLLPQGIALVFLFTLLHETSHATPFRTRWLNIVVGYVCGFLILIPAGWFRYFHFAHHRYTQNPDKDPELASPKPETLTQYLRHISGLPVWIGQIRVLLRNALGRGDEVFIQERRHRFVTIESWILLALYIAIAVAAISLGGREILFIWLLPLIIGQPFLRLYLLAEHGRCPLVADMFENSRTTFTIGLIRKLAWNMPYHAEHHAYPTVPFHRLPELHVLTRPHLKTTEHGYRRFHRKYLRWLRQ